jgi:hypothetical protein
MITTNDQLGKILDAICLMFDATDPDTHCSRLLTDAEGKYLLNGVASGVPDE